MKTLFTAQHIAAHAAVKKKDAVSVPKEQQNTVLRMVAGGDALTQDALRVHATNCSVLLTEVGNDALSMDVQSLLSVGPPSALHMEVESGASLRGVINRLNRVQTIA